MPTHRQIIREQYSEDQISSQAPLSLGNVCLRCNRDFGKYVRFTHLFTAWCSYILLRRPSAVKAHLVTHTGERRKILIAKDFQITEMYLQLTIVLSLDAVESIRLCPICAATFVDTTVIILDKVHPLKTAYPWVPYLLALVGRRHVQRAKALISVTLHHHLQASSIL